MLRLSLLRHAKSSWEQNNITDHDRPLKEKGRSDACLMARELASQNLLPDRILSSTSKRTTETVIHFVRETILSESQVFYDRLLYHAWAEKIFSIVRAQDSSVSSNIMIVGHNPGIHEFAEYMTDQRIEKFPTCAYVLMECDIPSWDKIEYGSAVLKEFLYPKKFD